MNNYTVYCTESQTKKALGLGAPITLFWEDIKENYNDEPYCEISPRKNRLGIMCNYAKIPTTEQMIGWLEGLEEIDEIAPMKQMENWIYVVYMRGARSDIESNTLYSSRPEATLAAIDAALDYLNNNKK